MRINSSFLIFTLLIIFSQVSLGHTSELIISKDELQKVAQQIYQNEAKGKRENLIIWNHGENFPSLGIGHFIWYKKNERDIFEESFPSLISFFKQKKVRLPHILNAYHFAPWRDRNQFMKAKVSGELEELEDFLYDTQELQIIFIYQRLQTSLDKMLAVTEEKNRVRKNFYAVADAPNGLYALIDYVNFKGEGINQEERYHGKGWGLLQVLENMKHIEPYIDKKIANRMILDHFRDSAKNVLIQRVRNSDSNKNEDKWLNGWLNRCNTYYSH